eukprot:14961-Heterococcus_DN1.PRE.2
MMLSRLLRVPSARGIACRSLASSAAKAPPLKDLKFHMDQGTEGLGFITFDRADRRDALSVEMAQSVVNLVEHLNQLHPGELRCVIITGSSEKSFSAGRDLRLSAEHTTEKAREEYLLSCVNSALAVGKLHVPTIACINGAAFGWGVEVALACDLRVASDAAQLCLPETGLGELKLPSLIQYNLFQVFMTLI